jgi:hypothetical protein
MKVLFTSIFTVLILASAIALPFDDVKIGSNAKTASLEIRFTSTHKKNRTAAVSISDEKGSIVNNFQVKISKGENIIPIATVLGLKEGLYTVNILVKKKTLSTKLMVFD